MSSTPLMPDAEVIDRVVQVDADYAVARMRLLENGPANRLGAAHRRIGTVTAFSCRALPTYYLNRVVGVGPADADLLDEILDWYDPEAPSPTVELPPTSLSRSVTAALTRRGFTQTGVHATVAVAAPAARTHGAQPDVRIEDVTDPETMAEFERTHLVGWGRQPPDPPDADSPIRRWLGQPGWRLYLARRAGVPVGTAILYLTPDVGYLASAATVPAQRGRGVQGALLRHRITVARAQGVDIVCGQAEFLSASYRNMLRAGVPLLYNQSLWTH